MKRLSGLLQFMVGFVLGVAILVGGATAVAYMLLSGMNSNPPKPVFTEEKKEETKEEKTAVKPSPTATTPVQEQPQAEVKESPTAAPAPKAAPKPSPEETKRETTSEGYQARVTWQSGLSLRSQPTSQSTRLGGLDYNTKVSVVGTSSDGQWQRVRLSDGREGWIKAGNISKVQ
ncbi:MAG: SH3 domain-containing protein [Microcystis wesenbergii Mw_MB_S_20031200_S109]|uniref:SH3 domain-containing protein n=1 Tax=Microcystis wesenbergii Mw_MB_S_20031200_S109D TaxID=2486241 RepID=A0A552LUT1_9CHRO|nr:MAG: SH3 domain-containing protein [Microcystis wesenbergii Mw_MB_S_20031200_S109]TRV23973.1 MAG: SH3 domain-containing protein [Microcystis wesenbergii Mw_MB_S_20031200_S109D]